MFKAEQWFGTLTGQDIIICGLGPSARTIPPAELADHWIIGCNNMGDFTFIVPDFLVLVDAEARFSHEGRWDGIRQTRAKVVFHWEKMANLAHPVMAQIDLHAASHDPISGMDTPTGIPAWHHTPHVAAALAVRMGAARVFFIGVDLNDPTHPTGKASAQIMDGMGKLADCAKGDFGCDFYTMTEESALLDLMDFSTEVKPKQPLGEQHAHDSIQERFRKAATWDNDDNREVQGK